MKVGLFFLWATFPLCLQAAQLPVTLNSAGNFTVLGSSTVTNTGPTIVNGNVGLFPGSAVTGFPPGTVVGGSIHAADATAGTAQGDLTAAYNDAAGRTAPTIIAVPDIGGQTLPAGLYKTGATPSVGITGTLTLDGGGNANAVFIFQIASTLTTASGSQVVLINGANAANIFWQVGSSATLGTTSIFNGTILAQVSITVKTGATLNGRALARTGAVTLDSNIMVNPGAPIVGPTPPTLTSVTCPLPSAVVGVSYSSVLVPTGGTPAFTFSITGGLLPAGLSLNASTGAVTGTPTGAGGTSSFSTNATDSEVPPVTATNSTCSITVTPATSAADVSIVKSGPATVVTSSSTTYTLTVSNAGPIAAANVTVTDILPAGTTFTSATASQGSCSFTSAVVCSLGTMASGASASVVLVLVSPNGSGAFTNTATVVSTTPDPNTANNTSSWTVTLTAATAPSGVPALSTLGLAVLAMLLAAYSMRFLRKARL
jgi:uncharacterized repeat protein (TIGR01451 family)